MKEIQWFTGPDGEVRIFVGEVVEGKGHSFAALPVDVQAVLRKWVLDDCLTAHAHGNVILMGDDIKVTDISKMEPTMVQQHFVNIVVAVTTAFWSNFGRKSGQTVGRFMAAKALMKEKK